MTKSLFFQVALKFALGAIIIAGVLFGAAGSWAYWNAWLLMGLLFIPMLVAGGALMCKNPDLLRKRLHAKEKESEQKRVITLSGLMFLSGFVVAGLNFRFAWMMWPEWLTWMGAVLCLLAYGLYAEVLRENTYLSRTIEVQSGQKVVDTGLYGIVRHPMYSATILLFLSFPLVLGSPFAFVIFLTYPILIAKRIKHEEVVLEKGLDGYVAYKRKIKYKIIPFVW